ncbi:MAG: MlaD family protein, partial [Candidatus Methylomirabilales bacterium]
MEPRSSVKIVVGLFVFAGLLLFAASIFFLGERGRYFAPQHPLKAFFTNAAGLHQGAMVRLAGVAVGRVTGIRLPSPPERKVLVELNVAGGAIENVRRDSVARIETIGFLGDTFVAISVGSPQEPRLPDGATLRAEEPADFGAL